MDSVSHFYLWALFRANLRVMRARWRQFLLTSLMLFIQNGLFFCMWIIFFGTVKDVRGWGLPEVEIFQGVVNAGLGFALFFGDGSWHIDGKIERGDLDVFLTKPRHPLPLLVLGESFGFSGPGHFAFGLLLFGLAHLSLYGGLLVMLASLLAGGLILAVNVCCKTLAFYLHDSGSLPNQLMDMFVVLSIIPQHTEGAAMKFFLYTILPAGFMAVLPVEIVRRESLGLLFWLAVAVAGYSLLAIALFDLGLRRYTSATGWRV